MFEATLIASRKARSGRSALASVPVAVGIHGAVLGLFFVAQLWAVEPVPEPFMLVGFVCRVPAPPPATKGTSKGHPEHLKSAATTNRERVTQPIVIPNDPPAKTDPTVAEHPSSVDGSDPFAASDGDNIGADYDGGNGLDEEPGPATSEDTIYVPGGLVESPRPIHQIAPAYPEIARTMKRQGTVIVQATIDSKGNVINATLLRGIGFGCDEAALDAIRQWKYKPAIFHDRPVAVYLTVTFVFTLH